MKSEVEDDLHEAEAKIQSEFQVVSWFVEKVDISQKSLLRVVEKYNGEMQRIEEKSRSVFDIVNKFRVEDKATVFIFLLGRPYNSDARRNFLPNSQFTKRNFSEYG